MRKTILKLLVVFVGLGFATSALAIDVPLKYQKHPAELDDFYPRGSISLTETMEPPSGEWKFPALVSEHPIYAFVKIGDTQKLCILDQQNASDRLYNRFYLDSNGNGDLTDDPFVEGTVKFAQNNQRYTVDFPGVDTKIEIEGKSVPYSFRPSASVRSAQLERRGFTKESIRRYVAVVLRLNCSYTGEFKIKGQKYRVILGDYNCNGRFNDQFSLREVKTRAGVQRMPIFSRGDGFIITTEDKIDAFDLQICGDWLVVNDKLFEVSINTAKGKMTLMPATDNLGSLELAMKTERISLYTEDGKHCLMMYRPSKKIKVPAGKYRLLKYQAFKQDKQGDLWRLCASANTESPFITVSGNREAVLKFGEPFVSKVNVRVKEGSSRASLSFAIEGQAKESLADLSHISGDKTQIPLSEEEDLGHRPKEPTYKIVKADGEVVTQGSFEYG
jgi:hypothetical protein